jgi:primosomal replication protein N
MNRVLLSATILERQATRYTPAGVPAVDLSLGHESQLSEAGQVRQVRLELKAVGLGEMARRLETLPLGHSARFAGFLSAQRNGRGLKLHITDIETEA